MYKVKSLNHSLSQLLKDILSLEVYVDETFMIIIFSNNVQVWEHGQ